MTDRSTAGDERPVGFRRVGTLLAAGAAAWEPEALEALAQAGPSVVLVKRCLDLGDLLSTAATGTAMVAVVSDRLPGLDADAYRQLGDSGVRVVVVADPSVRPGDRQDERPEERDGGAGSGRHLRMGAALVVQAREVRSLARQVQAAAVSSAPSPSAPGQESGDPGQPGDPGELGEAPTDVPPPPGRLIAVWGPTGAPGRTTVAIGVAAELASRGLSTFLLDADPYGGAVAQHLAVLDDVSGLLSAVRSANAGHLEPARLAGLARQVHPALRVLTGLPRPQRWTEVRPQAFADLLETACQLDPFVVVDTGLGIDTTVGDPFDPAPGRDDMTRAVLEEADDVVVVASADPVGLSRLARSLLDLVQLRPSGPSYVVVNRMRRGLGWGERDLADMVSRVTPGARLLLLPEDRVGADRAIVSGRTLVESGDSPLRRAMAALADTYLEDLGLTVPGARARRRAGRWRTGGQTVRSR